MPEHIRALIVILVLATAVFAFARAPACAVAIQPADFARRRNLWFVITLIAFVAGNFWVYVLLTAIVVLVTLPGEQNRMALFLGLVFAVPPVAAKLPGLGLVEHLFALNHVRLLALTILLPTFLLLVSRPDTLRFGRIWPDRLLLAYIVLNFGIMLYATTFTNAVRHGLFYAFLDVFLPYFVASRSLKSIESLRDALMTFVVAAMVLSAIALFEWLKHWLLYPAVVHALDVQWGYGGYLGRAGAGLRAQGSTGHPIALGFSIAVAISLFLYARTLIPKLPQRRLAFALLAAGLVASLSRGPWLGAAAGVLAFVATGPGSARVIARMAVIGVVALPLANSIPGIRDLIEYLPFVGSVESANVDYRRRLIEIAFDAIWQSPLFGGIDIYSVEEADSLRQGEGGAFIDVVNTYVGILLGSGFVGLGLFLGFFLAVGVSLRRASRVVPAHLEHGLLGRALLASLVTVLVTILTTSSITTIPIVYWSLAGVAVAYARLRPAMNRSSETEPRVGSAATRLQFKADPVTR